MDSNKRWQFSLKKSLLFIAIVSVWLAIQFSLPAWVQLTAERALAVAYSVVLTATIVYGHGNIRAFAIGALFPPIFLVLFDYPRGDVESIVWVPASIFLGFVTIAVKNTFQNR